MFNGTPTQACLLRQQKIELSCIKQGLTFLDLSYLIKQLYKTRHNLLTKRVFMKQKKKHLCGNIFVYLR